MQTTAGRLSGVKLQMLHRQGVRASRRERAWPVDAGGGCLRRGDVLMKCALFRKLWSPLGVLRSCVDRCWRSTRAQAFFVVVGSPDERRGSSCDDESALRCVGTGCGGR